MLKIRICKIENCNKKCAKKGTRNGIAYFRTTCILHRNSSILGNQNSFVKEFIQKQNLDNSKCEICGWNEAPCDRHKIIPSLGYTKENVKILCPNCHRKVTLKYMIIN